MARHTIGNKRGSVRGAPPDVYIPFGSFTDGDEREPWEDAFNLGKMVLKMAAAWVVIWSLIVILWAVGILPDELADY